MRYALPLVVSALLAAVVVGAPVPPPTAREATQLVEKLGSEDFAEREAASRRLDELGILALAEVRAATKSENAEVANRAKELVRTIERRVSNERAIAPTTVELDLTDTPLDAVLAELSKQAGCEVVLGGLKPEQLAGTKVTVATGKVPFWSAVVKVCDAGKLQVAGAGGFFAPGATPYAPRQAPKGAAAFRVAANPGSAVILEARDGPKRPASVHGAVLIEAFELPKAAASNTVAAVVLQVWPEPRLSWQATADVKVTKATDATGRVLVPDLTQPVALPQVQRVGNGGVIVVRHPDGTVTIVNPAVDLSFTPNARQALVKLKTGVNAATELTGSVYGLVRSPPEPLVVIALNARNEVTATGPAGTEATATLNTDADGKRTVSVTLTYDPLKVNPVRTSDELPDVKLTPNGNQSVHGLCVTDAGGKAFDLSLAKAVNSPDRTRQGRIILAMRLDLSAAKDGPTVPAKLVFWGNYAKPVGVPFALKDVPLVGGAK